MDRLVFNCLDDFCPFGDFSGYGGNFNWRFRGNLLGLQTTPWVDFLAGFGSIVLTFLAGSEVDPAVLRSKFKESFLIGVASFLLPFIACFAYAYYFAGWSLEQSQIAGIALSTTSVAIVYAVMVETGLNSK